MSLTKKSAKIILVLSIIVIALAIIGSYMFPKEKEIIWTAVVVSPIPPVP